MMPPSPQVSAPSGTVRSRALSFAALSSPRAAIIAALSASLVAALAAPAQAFPGFYAGKGQEKRINHVTQVVVAKRGEETVVSVWPDYEGPMDKFAVVLPVPSDVKAADVRTLKRDVIDRLDDITAPRFHEFWEMDPCEQGQVEQEWERDLTVKGGDTGFLGMAMPEINAGTRLPPELLLNLKPPYKDGEYKFSLVPKGKTLEAYLSSKGLSIPGAAASAVKRYDAAGTAWLVAEVDSSQVELTGAKRALLSPIRFSTGSEYKISSTLGLANGAGKQELIVYVLHPEQRFEVANYPNVFAPTNVGVDFKVKERMGEFYASLHDALLKKNPKGFLTEYAWPTIKQCGQPCPNDPLQINELLGLGGDFFDESLPDKERNPEPPPMTEEETKQLATADKETKKRMKEQRVELVRRRALLERNRYVITRLHHRYDAAGLPEDIVLKAAGHVQGGLGEPNGPRGDLPTAVEPAEQSRLQTRFTFLHPSKSEEKCENPVRWRWGKAPRSYRGLRKVWTAKDMDRKSRTQFASLKEVITTSVPALDIDVSAPATEAAPPPPAEKSGCAFVAPDSSRTGGLFGVIGLGLVGLLRRRR
jgi:MYXO-CTERM domain-containing protein